MSQKYESEELGRRLRNARSIRGMSQRKLAGLCDVNNSTISLIEQGRLNPSVSVMMKLLAGLGMGFSEFWDEQNQPPVSAFIPLEEQTVAKTTGTTYFRVSGQGEFRNLLMQREIYEPGAGTGDRMITHDSEEAGFILEGRVEVVVGDEVKVLKAGDAYYFDSRIPHRFRNVSRARAVIVSACTPPSF